MAERKKPKKEISLDIPKTDHTDTLKENFRRIISKEQLDRTLHLVNSLSGGNVGSLEDQLIERMEYLNSKHVLIAGLGGVGSHVYQSMLRSGIKKWTLIDGDYISLSSLNRHAWAVRADVGRLKVDAASELAHRLWGKDGVSIKSVPHFIFLEEDDEHDLPLPHGKETPIDLVIDCIDQIVSKYSLLQWAHDRQIPAWSSLGSGAKVNPIGIQWSACLWTIHGDALGFQLRREYRRRHLLKNQEKPTAIDESNPWPLCRFVWSPEIPKASLADPLDVETDMRDYIESAVPTSNFRVRKIPVWEPLPAIFGHTISTMALTDILELPLPCPVPNTGGDADKVYQEARKYYSTRPLSTEQQIKIRSLSCYEVIEQMYAVQDRQCAGTGWPFQNCVLRFIDSTSTMLQAYHPRWYGRNFHKKKFELTKWTGPSNVPDPNGTLHDLEILNSQQSVQAKSNIEKKERRREDIVVIEPLAPSADLLQTIPDLSVDHKNFFLLEKISEEFGANIYAQREYDFTRPDGYTSKRKAAINIIKGAEKAGFIKPNDGWTLYEGSSGNMGVELARYGRILGYSVHICIEKDQAPTKIIRLRKEGARVTLVPRVASSHPRYYANYAKQLAKEDENGKGYFCDQFHNVLNAQSHLEITGPAIYNSFRHLVGDSSKQIDAVVVGAGTGGTICGLSKYFHHKCPSKAKVCLADVPGSGLVNYVKHGVCWDTTEATDLPGSRRTWVDGIGQNRLTDLFRDAEIDHAFTVTDKNSQKMIRWVAEHEDLEIGPSSAVNICAASMLAEKLTKIKGGSAERLNIVTIFHDTAYWYQSAMDLLREGNQEQ